MHLHSEGRLTAAAGLHAPEFAPNQGHNFYLLAADLLVILYFL